MGISGNLSTIGLPDVLQLLSTGGKTGTLLVTRGADAAHVYFQEGNIIYASSTTRKDALLNILIRNGNLALEDAERIRIRARTGKNPIEKILQQGNFVSSDMLMDAAMTMAREIVYELFQWFDGDFQFMEGELPPGSAMDLTVSLGAFKLIMEGARRIDEWSRIRKVIPSLDAVFLLEADPDPEKYQFSREDLVILSLIDGKTAVRKICQTTGNSEFEICRILYGFKTAGLITAISRPLPETQPTPLKQPIYKSKPFLAAAAGLLGVILVAAGFLLGGSGDPRDEAAARETPIMQTAINSRETTTAAPDTFLPSDDTVTTGFMDSGEEMTPAGTMHPGVTGSPAESPAVVTTVPESPTPAATPTPMPPPVDTSGKININTAGAAELETLPRIGPATARSIIEHREKNGPFRTPRDLMNVPRIGEKTFQSLESLITCGSGTTSSAPPARTTTEAPEPVQSKPVFTGGKININTAGESELTSLPGIGPSKARAIIEYRNQAGPFRDIHDITNVPGIGEKSFQKMAEMMTVK